MPNITLESLAAKLDFLLVEVKRMNSIQTDCRRHCDTTSAEVFNRVNMLEAVHDMQEGRERERAEYYRKRDSEEHRKQNINLIAGAIIAAVGSILAGIGGALLTIMYMGRP